MPLESDTCSKSLIVFPIADGEKILDVLSMHYRIEAHTFLMMFWNLAKLFAFEFELARFLDWGERAQFQKEVEGESSNKRVFRIGAG